MKGAPAALSGVEIGPLLTDLADQLGELDRGRRWTTPSTISSRPWPATPRSARTRSLAPEEARALLDGLDGIDFKARCPHGRPVVFELPLAELERRVGRR